MKRLTPRQQQIYDYLASHLDDHGYPPTLREICAEFGMKSTRAASDHLHALERKGFINRARDRSRGIELVGSRAGGKGQSVPLVGKIAAGEPILAVENVSERFTLDPQFLNGDGNFLLEVEGTSMIDAHICPGDHILVRPQESANNGDIVVAMIDEEATVKRFEKNGSGLRLIPENQTMGPIEVSDSSEFKILGKVVGLIRKI
ncbi:MAG: transcriptional repressor LexA [Candidatus Eisenbacteria bacterium]|uniref:LexA repressor n=1 Tax=Eiseniibacteriota bacterium TaxID=2212470 RepID=A0A7Y2EAF1_UNCEI|nr:transcriptional repressor LexA [Candidatus Eisenbacteria bacterium]